MLCMSMLGMAVLPLSVTVLICRNLEARVENMETPEPRAKKVCRYSSTPAPMPTHQTDTLGKGLL